jgi:hypothetical protein
MLVDRSVTGKKITKITRQQIKSSLDVMGSHIILRGQDLRGLDISKFNLKGAEVELDEERSFNSEDLGSSGWLVTTVEKRGGRIDRR